MSLVSLWSRSTGLTLTTVYTKTVDEDSDINKRLYNNTNAVIQNVMRYVPAEENRSGTFHSFCLFGRMYLRMGFFFSFIYFLHILYLILLFVAIYIY